MNDLIKKNMGIVLGILVVIGALVVYLNFFAGKSTDLLTSSSADIAASQEILSILTSLNTIKLDNAIFTNPVFQSLTSYGVELAPENVGRRNPFEPLNGK